MWSTCLTFVIFAPTSISWRAIAPNKIHIKAFGCFSKSHRRIDLFGTQPKFMDTAMLTIDHKCKCDLATLLVSFDRWASPTRPRISTLLSAWIRSLSTEIPSPSGVPSSSSSPRWSTPMLGMEVFEASFRAHRCLITRSILRLSQVVKLQPIATGRPVDIGMALGRQEAAKKAGRQEHMESSKAPIHSFGWK